MWDKIGVIVRLITDISLGNDKNLLNLAVKCFSYNTIKLDSKTVGEQSVQAHYTSYANISLFYKTYLWYFFKL